MFVGMNKERDNIIKSLVELVYFMRGSVQYESMKNMTKVERQAVSDFIEKRLEIESKKMYPNY
jgi:hypothetical protein